MVGSTLAYTTGELQFIHIKFMLKRYHMPALSVLGSIGKKTEKVKEKERWEVGKTGRERGEGKGRRKGKSFCCFFKD